MLRVRGAASVQSSDTVVVPRHRAGEPVFMPLRLSFIVPCNLVLDTLMMSGAPPAVHALIFFPPLSHIQPPLHPARGTMQVVGAQWLNQTYNALHYRANRNASNEEEGWEVAQAYCGATASSVAAAVTMEHYTSRAPPTSTWAPILRRLGPLAAVAAADVLNVGLMRRKEYTHGVHVRTDDGTVIGKSKVAGSLAVSACIAGRVFAAAPILTIPPLILMRLERSSKLIQARPLVGTAALMAMVGVAIQVSVPLTFGLFKQTASVPAEWLEPELAAAAPGKRLFYNKGI